MKGYSAIPTLDPTNADHVPIWAAHFRHAVMTHAIPAHPWCEVFCNMLIHALRGGEVALLNRANSSGAHNSTMSAWWMGRHGISSGKMPRIFINGLSYEIGLHGSKCNQLYQEALQDPQVNFQPSLIDWESLTDAGISAISVEFGPHHYESSAKLHKMHYILHTSKGQGVADSPTRFARRVFQASFECNDIKSARQDKGEDIQTLTFYTASSVWDTLLRTPNGLWRWSKYHTELVDTQLRSTSKLSWTADQVIATLQIQEESEAMNKTAEVSMRQSISNLNPEVLKAPAMRAALLSAGYALVKTPDGTSDQQKEPDPHNNRSAGRQGRTPTPRINNTQHYGNNKSPQLPQPHHRNDRSPSPSSSYSGPFSDCCGRWKCGGGRNCWVIFPLRDSNDKPILGWFHTKIPELESKKHPNQMEQCQFLKYVLQEHQANRVPLEKVYWKEKPSGNKKATNTRVKEGKGGRGGRSQQSSHNEQLNNPTSEADLYTAVPPPYSDISPRTYSTYLNKVTFLRPPVAQPRSASQIALLTAIFRRHTASKSYIQVLLDAPTPSSGCFTSTSRPALQTARLPFGRLVITPKKRTSLRPLRDKRNAIVRRLTPLKAASPKYESSQLTTDQEWTMVSYRRHPRRTSPADMAPMGSHAPARDAGITTKRRRDQDLQQAR